MPQSAGYRFIFGLPAGTSNSELLGETFLTAAQPKQTKTKNILMYVNACTDESSIYRDITFTGSYGESRCSNFKFSILKFNFQTTTRA